MPPKTTDQMRAKRWAETYAGNSQLIKNIAEASFFAGLQEGRKLTYEKRQMEKYGGKETQEFS